MNSPPSSAYLLVLFLQIISLVCSTSIAFDPLFTDCSGGNYTSTSVYASNLRFLLSSLVATTPNSKTFIYNKNIGLESFEGVYGVAQCRQDSSFTICADCLSQIAAAAINGSCAGRRSAYLRYDYCIIRYADHYFYSDPMNLNYTNKFKPESALSPASFRYRVDVMLEKLMLATSNSRTSFAVSTITYDPPMQTPMQIYALAWCTMLSKEDCYMCLNKGFDGYMACCLDQIGGWVASGSCAVGYDNRPFFNLSFLQMAASPPGFSSGTRTGRKRKNIILICGSVVAATLALVLCGVIILFRRSHKISEENMGIPDSLLLPFTSLKVATNNFSNENKLREGRFGPAYKGVLPDGRPIMVNRLSNASQKGFSEFRKEVALVAQLQHKNLVKLLGYCLQNNEKLLVFEYLSNACLDEHLFDPARREKLDWKKRLSIIEGIARGLVYMHNHSRLRIIHRDLNAKNVLLDDNMKPKISDFGLAKLVGSNESQLNTKLIAGTFGYMAPEYATRGYFSTKSDVFSYGMVVLEIITGRRNCSFVEFGNSLNLQTFVWQNWNEGKVEEVIDQGLGGQFPKDEVSKCLNIGLLCIQSDPVERPSMSTVMLFLRSDTTELPVPSLPAFFTGEYPPTEPIITSPSTGTSIYSPSIRCLSRISS